MFFRYYQLQKNSNNRNVRGKIGNQCKNNHFLDMINWFCDTVCVGHIARFVEAICRDLVTWPT